MTSTEDVDVIRYGLREETDMRVCLLNYRKNGTAFLNQFNLSPLRDTSGKLVRCPLVFVDAVIVEFLGVLGSSVTPIWYCWHVAGVPPPLFC